MRVLVFLHSFEPGGVERVALRLCKAWVSDGMDVKLVLGRADGAMRNEAGALDYGVLSDGRLPTAAWETLWMILRLPGVIRRERPDVLFCAGNSYTIVSVVMKLVLGSKCPPIVAKISNDLSRADFPAPVRWLYRCWLRIQGRHIDRFVGMAPPMRDEIAVAMNVDRNAVRIVDDPALSMTDIERFAPPRPKVPERNRFVAAGRLAPQKNFPLLLRAFARIARDNDSLIILGEGPERAVLERLAKSLGVADRVTLAGHVADLAPWFADADVFALSSDYEGVPAVIAEALAAGLAIAATNSSVSMNDMLADGRFGEIVAPNDLDAFAAALERCRTSNLDFAGMRLQAERFTVEKAAAHYAAIFAETVNQTPPLTPDTKRR
jgi:glycosyltransferase involved in cell wall biosynthesis